MDEKVKAVSFLQIRFTVFLFSSHSLSFIRGNSLERHRLQTAVYGQCPVLSFREFFSEFRILFYVLKTPELLPANSFAVSQSSAAAPFNNEIRKHFTFRFLVQQELLDFEDNSIKNY